MLFWVLWACLAMSTKKLNQLVEIFDVYLNAKNQLDPSLFLRNYTLKNPTIWLAIESSRLRQFDYFLPFFFLNGHKNVTILRLKKKYQEIDQTLKLKKNELCGVIFWLIAKLDIYSCNFTSSFFYIFEMWKYHSKRQNCG